MVIAFSNVSAVYLNKYVIIVLIIMACRINGNHRSFMLISSWNWHWQKCHLDKALYLITYYFSSLFVVVSMRPEFVVNLICPAVIILFGTIGNGLALWTLFFSKILRNRIAR